MQGYSTEDIQRMQRSNFGKRFQSASLAQFGDNNGDAKKITKWRGLGSALSGMLVISGPAGTGKTHMLASLYENLVNDVTSVRVYSDRDLFRRLRAGFSQEGDYLETLNGLLNHHVVMIDDFGSCGHTEWREEVLLEALDIRYRSMRPTVITTNLNQEQVTKEYGERIASRLFAADNTKVYSATWTVKR